MSGQQNERSRARDKLERREKQTSSTPGIRITLLFGTRPSGSVAGNRHAAMHSFGHKNREILSVIHEDGVTIDGEETQALGRNSSVFDALKRRLLTI